jgi:hypothetical protein
MSKHGSIELVKDSFNIAVKAPAGLTANHTITLPTSAPTSTQGVQRNTTGQESYFTPVTSLNLSTAVDTFLAATATAGAFNLDLDTQAANLIFASPTTGVAAKPSFRNLVLGDFGATPPKLTDWTAPTTPLSLNTQRITGLADPTAPQDGATKAYTDALIQGFSKTPLPARVATTANITLVGLQTIDTIALVVGDRVVVKNQITASENGIYVVAAGAWTRATDADTATELYSAVIVFVQQGTVNADTGWLLATDGTITIGTSPLNFTQFTGLGQVVDGAGLTKTGNQLDVVGNAGRIIVNANDIDLATTGVTSGTYNNLTVDTYGRATGATNQPYSKVYRSLFTSANLSAGILTVPHGLGQQFCQVQVWDNTNKRIEADDYTATSATAMAVDLTSYGTITGTWNVVVVG